MVNKNTSAVSEQVNEELINIARGKKASQSSYSESTPNHPNRAVNGIKNGNFSFCTKIEETPWWMVDLGDCYPIRSIKIFNTENGNFKRAKDFSVQLSSNLKSWETIAEINYSFGGYISGSPLVLEFPKKHQPTGRFVKLQLLGKNHLHLDEVEVFTTTESYIKKKTSQDFQLALKSSRGIVHIGANKGQEAELYARHNKPVIWIEALPETYAKLLDRIAAYPNQQAINALVTDKDGEEYKFNISNNNDGLSSILEFGDDGSKDELFPNLRMVDSVSLVGKTLNTIYKEFQIDENLFDCLVLDVQGAELLVLKGAESVLHNFKHIMTEVSTVNIYKNGVLWDELKTFLNQKGFKETIARTPEKHGNVLFTAAKAYIKQGNKLKRDGEFEAAIACYKNAVEANPHLSWSYFYLAEALVNQKRLDEAIEAYRHAIELNPKPTCFYSGLEDAFTKNGQLNEAQKSYQNLGTTKLNLIPQTQQQAKLEKPNIYDAKNPKQLDSLETFDSIKYKGQLLQDKWVVMMTKGKQKGVFLEIGATDGIKLNNTFCLEKKFSWSGICVEPNPDFYKKLCLNRTAITLPYAFYKQSGQIVEFVNHGVLGTIAEFSSTDFHGPNREKFISERGTIKVITARPEDILSLYKFPEYFDFLSLDVEGAELDVLESFNLSKWQPALMCVEHNRVADKRLAIFKLLSNRGYQRIECRWDDWYYNLNILQVLNPGISLSHYQQVLEYFCQHHDCKLIEQASFQAPKSLVKENVNNAIAKKTYFDSFEQPEKVDRPDINDNELVNIAIGKKALQSSYCQYSKPGDPMRAVNGAKNGKFSFCTEIEEKPWWMVDLGGVYPIELIKIFNREDHASERVKGLEIIVSPDSKQWRRIALVNYSFGGYFSGQPLVINFHNLPERQWARFIKLQLTNKNYLHLDEVEVFVSSQAFALYQTCQALNFNYHQLVTQEIASGNPIKIYRILNSTLLLRRIKKARKLDALEITVTQRFGNSIYQLVNAFYLCVKNEIPKIYTKSEFPYICVQKENSQNKDIQLLIQEEPKHAEVVLSGNFFGNTIVNPDCDSSVFVDIFDKYILPKIQLPDCSIKARETDLVIHFRSGDVFAKNSPHLLYGQPPLSFYQKVIAEQKPDRCILVFEDRGNVCIGELENFLKNSSISFICQSSDVYADISCLATSINLVASRGTFCNGVTLLTRSLKKVYFFEDLYRFDFALLRDAKVFMVSDKTGEFKKKVLNNNWKNTKEQKELMLSYDISNLDIELIENAD